MITTDNRDDTKERILDAALKRFIHYGAGKTTMNEIAEDLHCSKAALYYYFPDKHGLHMAVLERISELLFQAVETEMTKMVSASHTLLNILDIKYEFGCRFCQLEIFKIIQEKKLITSEQFQEFRNRELHLLTRIFEAGHAHGEFQLKNANVIAQLYQDTMEGIRYVITDGIPPMDVHSKDNFLKIIQQQRAIAKIFINGLKYKE
ncbi:transcriptional regulator, TetR family [Chitinophaga costaii]|uniref:Transcriptional regulator, TetR family n=1 Tax=Chitinophaga costaii TaxID=1335309 RepID=A0A1C4APB2_9BACT|nr:TetR/AcrR family transcriptional regulator [Chitinophaga costaii]PUZ26687.1 TetR/AcrR family transcriptional regulator [Chitinophaga costaii]SCB96351.1 transcriptional regulator, TetR family [Chitinophaga costaii]